MDLKIKIIAFIIGLIFFIFIWNSVRKNSIKPTYAFLWILIALFLLSISVFEPFYKWLSSTILGIEDARSIIYITIIGFLLIYVYYLTIKISKMSDQIQELISFTAILENQIKKIKHNDERKEN